MYHMGSDTRVLSAAIEEDSKLSEEFDEFQSKRGHISKSEAVRALLRSGLETQNQSTEEQTSGSDGVEMNLLEGNKILLVSLAYLLGSNTILTNAQVAFGETWGSIVFAFLGTVLIIGLAPVLYRELRKVVNDLTSERVEESTGEPLSSD